MEGDERPFCDFCELPLEEGETLTEVRLGPLPQAKRICIEGMGDIHRTDTNELRAQLRLLVEAISDHPSCEVQFSDHVVGYRMRNDNHTPVSSTEYGELPDVTNRTRMTEYEKEKMDAKVAAGLTIHPEPVESEPDAELCPRCGTIFD